MILDQYLSESLLCNVSVNNATSTAGLFAYRGDLVIEEGEIADTQGRRHPPKVVVKQAVVVTNTDKLLMVAGAIDDLANLPFFIEKYRADFADDIKLLFYVSNLNRSLIVTIEDLSCMLIEHEEGAVWTCLMDDFRLEKEDFKGQSAENKTLTMLEAIKIFKPNFKALSFNDALSFTVNVVREARGAV